MACASDACLLACRGLSRRRHILEDGRDCEASWVLFLASRLCTNQRWITMWHSGERARFGPWAFGLTSQPRLPRNDANTLVAEVIGRTRTNPAPDITPQYQHVLTAHSDEAPNIARIG